MGKGTVVRSTGSWYSVEDKDGQIYQCRVKGKLRLSGIRATNPIAVGDHVLFEVDEGHNQTVITEVKKRKNYIIRKASNLSKEYHILASNIDLAAIVVTIKDPVTYSEFIDRFLITAEAYTIPAAVIINKLDIYSENNIIDAKDLSDRYSAIGYETLIISVKQSIKIDEFKKLIEGKKTLLIGNSGSGKSSLINKLIPDLGLRTNKISSSHKTGQHTTTFPEMFKVTEKTYIIDTPGIKSFGIIDIGEEELYHYFPEIFNASHNCKYNNCMHVSEPGCAVIDAVEKSKISEQRYVNYLRILSDKNEKYRLI